MTLNIILRVLHEHMGPQTPMCIHYINTWGEQIGPEKAQSKGGACFILSLQIGRSAKRANTQHRQKMESL